MKDPYLIRSIDELPVLMDSVLVARLFGCTEENIRKLANKGEIPAYRIGKMLRFKKSDIIEYIDRNRLKF